MKISVENLGTIHKGEISLDKELTIFTGENNSGKSYMSYLCYGILDFLHQQSTNSGINTLQDYYFFRSKKENFFTHIAGKDLDLDYYCI